MFQGGFKEGQENAATLPEEDPVIFGLFLEWLYKDRLSKMKLATSTPRDGPFTNRIKLFQYAVKICLPQLQDLTMSDLMDNIEIHNRHPNLRSVIVSYESTPAGSPLRKFMARTLLSVVGTGTYSTECATDEIMGNADLVRDIIRLTGEKNAQEGANFDVLPWEMPRCDFHAHAPGADCAYMDRTM